MSLAPVAQVPSPSQLGLPVSPSSPGRCAAPRFLDSVRRARQTRHDRRRTEKTCVAGIRRYILFHHKVGMPMRKGVRTNRMRLCYGGHPICTPT